MKKKLLTALVAALAMTACTTLSPANDKAIQEGRQLILGQKAECVIVKDGAVVTSQRGRGVSPLLTLYDTHPEFIKDGIVVDKVIGRAAAFIAIKGGATMVHAEVMSEDAVELLSQHQIKSAQTLLVPRILNRKRDGLCPLEQSVLGLNDPDKALDSMRKRIAEMKK